MTIQHYRTGVSSKELELLLDASVPTDARAIYLLVFRQLCNKDYSPVSITFRQLQEMSIKEEGGEITKRRISTVLEHLLRVGLLERYGDGYSGLSYGYVAPLALPWTGFYQAEYDILSSPTLSFSACCIYALALRPFVGELRNGLVKLSKQPNDAYTKAISPFTNTRRHLTNLEIKKLLVDSLQELISIGLIQRDETMSPNNFESLFCQRWVLPLVVSESAQTSFRGYEQYKAWLAAL